MAKQVFYRQCILTCGSLQTTTWLREDKIKVGVGVTLKDSDSPDRIWTVAAMGHRETEEWVKDRRKAHERWRGVTDV